jgi:hypothetical protein
MMACSRRILAASRTQRQREESEQSAREAGVDAGGSRTSAAGAEGRPVREKRGGKGVLPGSFVAQLEAWKSKYEGEKEVSDDLVCPVATALGVPAACMASWRVLGCCWGGWPWDACQVLGMSLGNLVALGRPAHKESLLAMTHELVRALLGCRQPPCDTSSAAFFVRLCAASAAPTVLLPSSARDLCDPHSAAAMYCILLKM